MSTSAYKYMVPMLSQCDSRCPKFWSGQPCSRDHVFRKSRAPRRLCIALESNKKKWHGIPSILQSEPWRPREFGNVREQNKKVTSSENLRVEVSTWTYRRSRPMLNNSGRSDFTLQSLARLQLLVEVQHHCSWSSWLTIAIEVVSMYLYSKT